MLIVKNEKSKKNGRNYLALILERGDLPKIYLSFDRDVVCRVLGINYYTYYEHLKDDNYYERIIL